LWCKIIFKINAEQTKSNMKRIAFIYTLVETQFKEKYLKISQINSKYFKEIFWACFLIPF
jgi:hypothetical protein